MATSPSIPPSGIEVFYSYAHADEPLRDKLEQHLSLLQRQGVIAGWHDRRITAGTEWAGAIDAHLQHAQIILLLVSADFLASEYCYDVELQRAMARHEAGEARVIPIILRAVDWHRAPFGRLQALPRDGRPITSWPNQDEAFLDVARGIRAVVEPAPSRSRYGDRRHRSRRDLLDEVKGEVADRLAQSLHHAVLINLRKELQRRQVTRPWDMEVKIGSRPPSSLPPETEVVEVFDQETVAGKLLILGAPGAGKTTTLLHLAQALLPRAEADAGEPVPVLLTLSSWRDDHHDLAAWLVAELKLKYGVRPDIGQRWLDERRLLPLLDGLDELEATRLERCIQAINQFEQDYRPEHVVVCCRAEEYEACKTKLHLKGAIHLQPLTEAQIHTYLMEAGRPALWQNLQADPDMLALAASPLLLSMMTLALEELSSQDWQRLGSTEARRHYLFERYIERMLAREVKSPGYADEQMRSWLAVLAKQLKTQAQTEFLIEKLQPTWLSSRLQQWGYRAGVVFLVAMSVTLPLSLVGKLLEPIAMSMNSELVTAATAWLEAQKSKQSTPLERIFFYWPTLTCGLIAGVIIGLKPAITPVETLHWSGINAWKGMIGALRKSAMPGLRYGASFWLLATLLFSVIFYLNLPLENTITREWPTWGKIGRMAGLVSALMTGGAAVLLAWPWIWRSGRLREWLASWSPGALLHGLLSGLLVGLGLVIIMINDEPGLRLPILIGG